MSGRIETERELIETYLAPLAAGFPGAFGLKDDAALISLVPGEALAVTTDPVVEGSHFFPDDAPDDIAWKALAVNISDLAAKGAVPLAYTMALAFPAAPERIWMRKFADGLARAQEAFGCHLAGGDTDRTPGPLSISITAFGTVPEGGMVRRTTARIADHLYVTGTLGDAALGLALRRAPRASAGVLGEAQKAFLVARYLRPAPRVALASILRTYASAAVDISDGFVKDATRLVAGAGGGVEMPFTRLPLSEAARSWAGADIARRRDVLAGGGDYEIVCAVPPSATAAFEASCRGLAYAVTAIGIIGTGKGLSVMDGAGKIIEAGSGGHDHFWPGRVH